MRIARWWPAAVLGVGLAWPAAAATRKVIIDQDAFDGTGLQPVLMLLQDPAVEVLGITIVSGDGWAPEETATTLRMLELVGRTDVPVVQGAIYPLVNSKERNRRREALYGTLPYKGAWADPPFAPPLPKGPPTTKAHPGSAAEFLLSMTRQHPGEISILAMGPLTNLALAQRLDDGFAGRVKEVVMEGGTLTAVGRGLDQKQDEFGMNVAYSPRMAFNLYWDPEAAHIVLSTKWRRLVLVTDDASAPAIGTKELLARACAGHRPVGRLVEALAQPGFPLWDEVAVAAWIDPAVVTRRGTLAMDVDLMPGPNYGALLTWPPGQGPGLGEQDVEIISAVDVPKVDAMFVELIGR